MLVGSSDAVVFTSVWYRDRPPIDWHKPVIRQIPIRHDVGTLTVDGDSARFAGRKGEVTIRNVSAVSRGRARPDWPPRSTTPLRSDPGDNWIRVDYDDGRTAFLVDGRFFGWAGVFGGNNRLYAALAQLPRHRPR